MGQTRKRQAGGCIQQMTPINTFAIFFVVVVIYKMSIKRYFADLSRRIFYFNMYKNMGRVHGICLRGEGGVPSWSFNNNNLRIVRHFTQLNNNYFFKIYLPWILPPPIPPTCRLTRARTTTFLCNDISKCYCTSGYIFSRF